MEIDNNNNNQDSDPDDPTLELEPLSEAARNAILQAEEASAQPDAVAKPEDAREARPGTSPPAYASEIHRLRDELKFRADMNSILRHCNDQLREKCDGLEEQVASLLKNSEMLRTELKRSRQEGIPALAESVPDPEAKPATRQEQEQRSSSGEMRTAPTRPPGARPAPDGGRQECLVLLGANGIDTDTWFLDEGISTIGSGPDCTIRIQSSFVSRHHARLIKTKSGSVLEDLDSTNGTYINARRITKRSIRVGDLVTIGKHRLEYRKRAAHRVGNGANKSGPRLHSG